MVTLEQRAATLTQIAHDRRILDALGDHLQTHMPGHGHDGLYQRCVVGVLQHVAHKGTVYLEFVHGQPFEI